MYTCMCLHVQAQSNTQSLTHTQTHSHTHARACAYTHTRACVHAHKRTHTYTHKYSHTRTHTHTHTHKHMHTHPHPHPHMYVCTGTRRGDTGGALHKQRQRNAATTGRNASKVSSLLNIVDTMGWLRLVGSMKLYVSFAKEPYKRDDILQERSIIFPILLTVATPY